MPRPATFLAVGLCLSTALALGNTALGAECEKVTFPESVKAASGDLVLNGLGIRKATFLKVHVYVAGLYLPAKSSDSDAILGADQPWHLVLHFLRDVDASDVRDAYQEGFEKAAGDKLATLQERIDAMNGKMVDFQEGQELSFTHDPGKGTAFVVPGTEQPTIEGADFASALLKINVGPEPPNEDLKTGLLGGPCE